MNEHVFIIEAKELRNTLRELRKQLEEDYQEIDKDELSQNDNSEDFDHQEKSSDLSSKDLFVQSQIVLRGLAYLRQSTAVIVGKIKDRGLILADTLVKCGIRKLILFDSEDATDRVEQTKSRWEAEENPCFELESYVTNYEFNQESMDHFIDRLENGRHYVGAHDSHCVNLVIITQCELDDPLYKFVYDATCDVCCPLLLAGHHDCISRTDSQGNTVMISYDSNTLGMAVLDILIPP